MEDPKIRMRARKLGVALRYISVLLVTAGISLLTMFLLIPNGEVLGLAAKEILLPDYAIIIIAVVLLLLVVSSGLVSLFRFRYGWFFIFFTASTILLMGFLMGTGTVLPTIIAFFIMMVLSLLLWADAVIYYFWDLYT